MQLKQILIAATLLFTGLVTPTPAKSDDMALQMLEAFLMDAAQRQAYAQQTAAGRQAEANLQAFPKYAQQEILNIVMMIMRQEKAGAQRYQGMNAQQAYTTFSPEVRTAVRKLSEKLMQDQSFLKNNLPAMSGLTH